MTLWSRRGNLFTAQFPDIAVACERLRADTLIDGEIAAVDESGRVSFNLLQHHRSQAQALLFYAFDVLICRGKSVVNLPLEERRKVLGEIFEKVPSKASPIKVSETIDATPTELVRVAKQLGFEGILAKRRDSYYEYGKRSGAWLKYRINRGQELVIGGYVPGNPIDSISGYYQDGTLLYAGKVRNGFVPQTRRAVAAKPKGLKIATCPFANLPERKRTQWALTKEEVKNCKWLPFCHRTLQGPRRKSPKHPQQVTTLGNHIRVRSLDSRPVSNLYGLNFHAQLTGRSLRLSHFVLGR